MTNISQTRAPVSATTYAPRDTATAKEPPAAPAAHADRRLAWLAVALVLAGLGMVPWLALLAFWLPASTVAWHWSAAWVGLDAMEMVGLLSTGILLRRRDDRCCLTATVTATLILVDGWFDVMTSAPGLDQMIAVGMAAFIEVPVSVLCAVLAVRQYRHAVRRIRP